MSAWIGDFISTYVKARCKAGVSITGHQPQFQPSSRLSIMKLHAKQHTEKLYYTNIRCLKHSFPTIKLYILLATVIST